MAPLDLALHCKGPGTGGVTAEIDRLSGISKKRREGPSLQLSDVMTLHPKYFPPELYNGKQRRYGKLPRRPGGLNPINVVFICSCLSLCLLAQDWRLLGQAAAILGLSAGRQGKGWYDS